MLPHVASTCLSRVPELVLTDIPSACYCVADLLQVIND